MISGSAMIWFRVVWLPSPVRFQIAAPPKPAIVATSAITAIFSGRNWFMPWALSAVVELFKRVLRFDRHVLSANPVGRSMGQGIFGGLGAVQRFLVSPAHHLLFGAGEPCPRNVAPCGVDDAQLVPCEGIAAVACHRGPQDALRLLE